VDWEAETTPTVTVLVFLLSRPTTKPTMAAPIASPTAIRTIAASAVTVEMSNLRPMGESRPPKRAFQR
jgi:ornithine cyclodeaminase/alanine dehydrogenase-like protein (mu-crystallin family)